MLVLPSTSIMLWEVDKGSQQALHEQIAVNIRRALADGTLRDGERLPPARELATVLGVNANTVLRAYRMLRTEGVLEFQRGRGVRVRSGSGGLMTVTGAARDLLEVGRRHGLSHSELAELLAGLAQEPA